MAEYNLQQKDCACSNKNIMCDCDEVVMVPLSLDTIVMPQLKPVYSVNQKPKVVHNINRVQLESNYN